MSRPDPSDLVSNLTPDPRKPYAIMVVAICTASTLLKTLAAPDLYTYYSSLFLGLTLLLMLGLYLSQHLSLQRMAVTGLLMGGVHLFVVTWAEGGLYSLKNHWLQLLLVCLHYMFKPRKYHWWLWSGLIVACVPLQALLVLYWPAPARGPGHLYLSAVELMDLLGPLVMIFLVMQLLRSDFIQAQWQSQQRREQLQTKQKELEHTAVLRNQFIDSVSHELRTPMNIILGLNGVLLERVHNKPQAQQVLRYTRQSASHLLTVINDVLDYSQWSSGQIATRIERFVLRDTVHTAFDMFKPKLEASDLGYVCEITDDVPQWVDSDRHRLTQVLVNLLGNAIKFTPDGVVSLRVSYSPKGVEFVVQDTGIGIAPEKQQHIFERFGQADPGIQSAYGGSGLGLPISQRLVKILGGELQLHSQVGVGTTIRFCLPLHAQVAPEPIHHSADGQPSPAQSVRRFLIVDDHPINRLLVRQVLKRFWPQAQMVDAQDGAVALQQLQQGPAFDMVVMDLVMPVMDGVEAVTAMRASGSAEIRQTPVLGLTANVTVSELERFKAAGLQGLLLKPFEPEQLRLEIERALYPAAYEHLQQISIEQVLQRHAQTRS